MYHSCTIPLFILVPTQRWMDDHAFNFLSYLSDRDSADDCRDPDSPDGVLERNLTDVQAGGTMCLCKK